MRKARTDHEAALCWVDKTTQMCVFFPSDEMNVHLPPFFLAWPHPLWCGAASWRDDACLRLLQVPQVRWTESWLLLLHVPHSSSGWFHYHFLVRQWISPSSFWPLISGLITSLFHFSCTLVINVTYFKEAPKYSKSTVSMSSNVEEKVQPAKCFHCRKKHHTTYCN